MTERNSTMLCYVYATAEGEPIGVHYPATAENVEVTANGALRITDFDGDVNIYAANRWAKTKIETRIENRS